MSPTTVQCAGLALGRSEESCSMTFDTVLLPSLPGAAVPCLRISVRRRFANVLQVGQLPFLPGKIPRGDINSRLSAGIQILQRSVSLSRMRTTVRWRLACGLGGRPLYGSSMQVQEQVEGFIEASHVPHIVHAWHGLIGSGALSTLAGSGTSTLRVAFAARHENRALF